MHRGLEQIMILNYRSWGLIAIDRCKISPRCRRSIGTAKPVKSSYWIDIRHANVSLYTCSTSNYSHSTLILWLACDRHSNDTTLHQPFDHFFFFFLLPHFSVRLSCSVRGRVHETTKETVRCASKHPVKLCFGNLQARVTTRIVSSRESVTIISKFLFYSYYRKVKIEILLLSIKPPSLILRK